MPRARRHARRLGRTTARTLLPRLLALVASASIPGLQAGSVAAQTYTRTFLGDLGGGFSVATSINDAGVVVGGSLDANDHIRAFRWSDGSMESLGTLGGFTSLALDLNEAGVVVGQSETANGETRPFVHENGAMTALPTLGGTHGIANAINENNVIVGAAANADGTLHAVRWQKVGGTWTATDLGTLGGTSSQAAAINDAGTIVGTARNAGGLNRAFRYSGGVMTDLGTLGGDTSSALGIDAGGTIVGVAQTATGQDHAFVRVGPTMTDLGAFGGSSSQAVGIAGGAIVGVASASNGTTYASIWTNQQIAPIDSLHDSGSSAADVNAGGWICGNHSLLGAILWTPNPEPLGVITLGTLGGSFSAAYAINASGQIAGTSGNADGNGRAFRWTDGVMTDLGTLGGPTSSALGINDHGHVVGVADDDEDEKHAFRWINGVMTDLGTLGGPESTATDINNNGLVVGHSYDAAFNIKPFAWENGSMKELPTLGGSYGKAYAVGENDVIVGVASSFAGVPRAVAWYPNGSSWTVAELLANTIQFSEALAITTDNVVVGQLLNQLGDVHAFRWREVDGSVVDLGTLGGEFSVARGANGETVVGASSTHLGAVHAARLSPDDGWRNLNDLLPFGSPTTLLDARAINASGWIVGIAQSNGQTRGYVARPGVGPDPAELLSYEVLFGSHVAGGVSQLLLSDDQVLRTRSRVGVSAFEPNLMEILIRAQTDATAPSLLSVTTEARLNNPGGTAKLRLRRWSTNAFQQVGSYPIGMAESTETIDGIAAGDFIRPGDGRIDLSTKHVVVATFSALGFDSFFDLVEIGVE